MKKLPKNTNRILAISGVAILLIILAFSIYGLAKDTKKQEETQTTMSMQNTDGEIKEEEINIEKLEEYNNKWTECFNNKDLSGMKNANKNIQKYLDKTLPLENTLKMARKIEIMQNLVENTGSFDITEEEQELATVLAQ